MKFHENVSSGSRFVPCGLTEGQTFRQADITKLIVVFHSFANAHNKNINTFGKQDIEFLNLTSGGTQSTH